MAAKLSGPGGDRYTVSQNSDINVTPFVDIMLVLLIIFMVSIPLATVSIKLDMPPPDKNAPQDKKKPIFVQIERDGGIDVAGNRSSLQAMPTDLAAAFRAENPSVADPRQNVVPIKADAENSYGQFMDVLNRLEDTGYLKIALITEDIQ